MATISDRESCEEATLIPSIPNDIAVNILARVPLGCHPILASVSKSFYSVVYSQHLYYARSLLGYVQPFLHLCIRVSSPNHSLRWYAVHYIPGGSPKAIPLPPVPDSMVGSAYASIGPRIYVIGGSTDDAPSQIVRCLDCRLQVWELVPNMRVAREFAAAEVVDGKLYVIGGCVADSWTRSRNWAEVYDPATNRWDPVDSDHNDEDFVRAKWMHASAEAGGKMYAMADRNGVVYEPRTKRWAVVRGELDSGWRGRACAIGGILYCYDYLGKIRGFDLHSCSSSWKKVRGLEEVLPRFLCGATLTNLGNNLVAIWEAECATGVEIWGAEIQLNQIKDNGSSDESEEESIWGTVLWCSVILVVPTKSTILHSLAVTL